MLIYRNVSSSFEDNNNEDVNLNAPEIDQSFSAKQSISIHSQQQVSVTLTLFIIQLI